MSTQSDAAPHFRLYYGCLANCELSPGDDGYNSSVDEWQYWNDWLPMTDNGDGTWSFTTSLATGVDYTYQYRMPRHVSTQCRRKMSWLGKKLQRRPKI